MKHFMTAGLVLVGFLLGCHAEVPASIRSVSASFNVAQGKLIGAYSTPRVGSIYVVRRGVPFEILALGENLAQAPTAPWYTLNGRRSLGERRIGTLEVGSSASDCLRRGRSVSECRKIIERSPITIALDDVQTERLGVPISMLEVLNRPLTGNPAFQAAEEQIISWRTLLRDSINAQAVGRWSEGVALCIGTESVIQGKVVLRSSLINAGEAEKVFDEARREEALQLNGDVSKVDIEPPIASYSMSLGGRPVIRAVFQKIYLTSFSSLPQFEFSLGETFELPVEDSIPSE